MIYQRISLSGLRDLVWFLSKKQQKIQSAAFFNLNIHIRISGRPALSTEVPFPGWVRYGSFFSERNTWWPYLKSWIDYKARLSAVFQYSEMQSDIAIMFPTADMWSEVGLQYQQVPQIVYPEYANNIWEAIHQNGGGCDYINENILQKCSFSGGKLHYNTRSYKALIMTEMESIAPETPELLRKFAAAGGQVIFIGKEPVKSFGKQNAAARDREVQSKIQSLKKDFPRNISFFLAPKDKIINWYAELQLKYNLAPFVRFDKPVSHVSQVYYKTDEADLFFISNYHLEKAHEFTATFNIKNKTAWLWDPETGKKYLYPYQGAKNNLKISLGPAQSMLIVFTNDTKGELYHIIRDHKNAETPLIIVKIKDSLKRRFFRLSLTQKIFDVQQIITCTKTIKVIKIKPTKGLSQG